MDFLYQFNLILHPRDYTTFHSFFSMLAKIFTSWQVCDWLAKWLLVIITIMLGFMDLRWPRVSQRSNVGLVLYWVHKTSFRTKTSEGQGEYQSIK